MGGLKPFCGNNLEKNIPITPIISKKENKGKLDDVF